MAEELELEDVDYDDWELEDDLDTATDQAREGAATEVKPEENDPPSVPGAGLSRDKQHISAETKVATQQPVASSSGQQHLVQATATQEALPAVGSTPENQVSSAAAAGPVPEVAAAQARPAPSAREPIPAPAKQPIPAPASRSQQPKGGPAAARFPGLAGRGNEVGRARPQDTMPGRLGPGRLPTGAFHMLHPHVLAAGVHGGPQRMPPPGLAARMSLAPHLHGLPAHGLAVQGSRPQSMSHQNVQSQGNNMASLPLPPNFSMMNTLTGMSGAGARGPAFDRDAQARGLPRDRRSSPAPPSIKPAEAAREAKDTLRPWSPPTAAFGAPELAGSSQLDEFDRDGAFPGVQPGKAPPLLPARTGRTQGSALGLAHGMDSTGQAPRPEDRALERRAPEATPARGLPGTQTSGLPGAALPGATGVLPPRLPAKRLADMPPLGSNTLFQAQPTAPLPEHSQVMTLMGREAELRARMEQHRKQIEQKQLQDAIKAQEARIARLQAENKAAAEKAAAEKAAAEKLAAEKAAAEGAAAAKAAAEQAEREQATAKAKGAISPSQARKRTQGEPAERPLPAAPRSNGAPSAREEGSGRARREPARSKRAKPDLKRAPGSERQDDEWGPSGGSRGWEHEPAPPPSDLRSLLTRRRSERSSADDGRGSQQRQPKPLHAPLRHK